MVTCALHGAQFDVTTSRKVKDFNLDLPSSDKLPDDYKRYTQYALNLVGSIKTHDQEKYKLIVDNDRIVLRKRDHQRTFFNVLQIAIERIVSFFLSTFYQREGMTVAVSGPLCLNLVNSNEESK